MYLFQVDSEKAGKEATAAWLNSQGHIFCNNDIHLYGNRWWQVKSQPYSELKGYPFNIFQSVEPRPNINIVEIPIKRKTIGGV